ncbi:MAG: Nif3-like dinuclear metal center hexameric protein [Clostridia bacterium]|nr:Nif3-like dinuclear metal center hexameric protein [Clostridia bacterium]
MKTAELYGKICEIIPEELCCSWDNDGLSVLPSKDHESRRILFALDPTLSCIEYAKDNGFDTVITHHPLLFRPLGELNGSGAVSRRALKLISYGIAHMSFHTRFDSYVGGTNSVICELFGIKDAVRFGPLGEEVGRCGNIRETSFDRFAAKVRKTLGPDHFSASRAKEKISKIAVCTGSGSDMTAPAIAAGADLLLCGELGYHETLDARELGLSVICAGHYETEFPAVSALADVVSKIGLFETEIYKETTDAI